MNLDSTLIATDRVAVQRPTTRREHRSGRRVDLWRSGKHHRHGGNAQVLLHLAPLQTAGPSGPLWVSPVRPGREHDGTCAHTHPDLLPALEEFGDAGHTVLADLGYEGERTRLTCPHKIARDRDLGVAERSLNRVPAYVRARKEQGNAWLKNHRALQKVSLYPRRIGAITAAALVVLHLEHERTA